MRGWTRSIRLNFAFLGVLLLWCADGCSRHAEPEPRVIARVGDATLSLADALAHIDTTSGAREAEVRRYVAHWVNAELLYAEARRRGIEGTEEFERNLDETRKQLATSILLDRSIYADTNGLPEDSARRYFERHAEEFVVRDDAIRLNIIAFRTRERASQFAASVSRGTSWAETVENTLRDSVTSAAVVSTVAGRYYTSHTLFPVELWKVADGLGVNEISFPVRASSIGYFVLQPISRLRAGAPADYELSRAEVRQRLMIEVRRRRYEELLGNLRGRYGVELLLDSLTAKDSLRYHE